MLPQIDSKVFKFARVDNKHTIACVPSTVAIESYWSYIRDELEKEPELWNKAHTIESLREHVIEEAIKVWCIYESESTNVKMWFFTTRTSYPVVEILTVVWASGRELHKYIMMALSALEEFAANNNYGGVVVDGRKGWGPVLAPFGYSELQVSFFKPVLSSKVN